MSYVNHKYVHPLLHATSWGAVLALRLRQAHAWCVSAYKCALVRLLPGATRPGEHTVQQWSDDQGRAGVRRGGGLGRTSLSFRVLRKSLLSAVLSFSTAVTSACMCATVSTLPSGMAAGRATSGCSATCCGSARSFLMHASPMCSRTRTCRQLPV